MNSFSLCSLWAINSFVKPLTIITMKKEISLLLCICSISMSAQTYELNLSGSQKKRFGYDEKLHVTEINVSHVRHDVIKGRDRYFLCINDKEVPVSSVQDEVLLKFNCNTIQELWDSKIISDVLPMLEDKGTQPDLRAELENDAIEFVSKVNEYGLKFNDPYLETYIYGLLAKIVPETLIDGRPCNVNLLIIQDSTPNAYIYPNGTLVITTGLLAVLHNEDELIAILSHEVAHFVLDHSIKNVNEITEREKRAVFWGAIATSIAAIGDAVIATNNQYYSPGAITSSVATLSAVVSNKINERLGMRYNHQQENDADKIAVKVLELLNCDKNALASALSRLKSSIDEERNNSSYFQSYTHPALVERIAKAGSPTEKNDQKFEKMISFAITSSSRLKFESRRFKQAYKLVITNINNGVATLDDYLIGAYSLLYLHNDSKNNAEVLSLIQKAKSINSNDFNIYKIEILFNLRVDNIDKAILLLNEYKSKLNSSIEKNDNRLETPYSVFIQNEIIWTQNMITKLQSY